MTNEKFLGLDRAEQAVSIVVGGFYVGFPLADRLVNKVEMAECQPITTTPTSPFAEMHCPKPLKTAELAGGSALIIASTFGAAAAILAVKRLAARHK